MFTPDGNPAMLTAANAGHPEATKRLFSALYGQLKHIARREIARAGGPRAPLGASSLLHHAYEAMAGSESPDRARFTAYAARVMRRLVIDHVRSRRAQKRGGAFELTALDADEIADGASFDPHELEHLSVAVDELGVLDPELSRVVELKFFSGFSLQEIAALDGVSTRTVLRRWNRARVFLRRALTSVPLD